MIQKGEPNSFTGAPNGCNMRVTEFHFYTDEKMTTLVVENTFNEMIN